LEPLGDTEDLFEIDEHYLEEMEEKRQLLQRMRSEVFASTPEVGTLLNFKNLKANICLFVT